MKKRLIVLFSIVSIGLATVCGYSYVSAKETYGQRTKTAKCVMLFNQALPDSGCTPGAILATSSKVICVSGYTKRVRNVSVATKKAVFKEYGIDYSKHSNFEVDHLISLELGGSNDISNLWPESYKITESALKKDQFENYLHSQICSGKMKVADAQYQISHNWLKYDKLRLEQAKKKRVVTGSKTTASNPVAPTVVIPPVFVQPVISEPSTGENQVVQSIEPQIKKSSTGICHEKGSTYYARTLNFAAYDSISDCLNSGGRMPLR